MYITHESGNLNHLITIDHDNKRLVSTNYSSENMLPCRGSSSDSISGVFDLSESFGKTHEKLSLESTPSTDSAYSDGGILFSLQGLRQNHQLSSTGVLELKLAHSDLPRQRCIRIISPIGMIRDGRTDGPESKCRYDKTN